MPITVEQARELAKQARDWASSEAGQREIREAVERAEKTIQELEKAQTLDPKKLSEPFTV